MADATSTPATITIPSWLSNLPVIIDSLHNIGVSVGSITAILGATQLTGWVSWVVTALGAVSALASNFASNSHVANLSAQGSSN